MTFLTTKAKKEKMIISNPEQQGVDNNMIVVILCESDKTVYNNLYWSNDGHQQFIHFVLFVCFCPFPDLKINPNENFMIISSSEQQQAYIVNMYHRY